MFRGWIVVAAGFFTSSTIGLSFCFGDFFIPVAQELHLSHATDSTIPGVSLFIFGFGAVSAGIAISKYGFRKTSYLGAILTSAGMILSGLITNYIELVLTFGVLMSFGSAIVVISGSVLAVRWFVQKRRLAVGIMAAGSGIGTLLVPAISEFLILTYSWRLAFILVGASFLVLLLTVSSALQSPEDRGQRALGQDASLENNTISKNYTTRQAISTLNFWQMFVMFFLGMIGVSLFTVHVVPFAYSNGVNEAIAAYSIAFLGFGSVCARIIIGLVSERSRVGLTLVIDFTLEALGLLLISILGSSVPALYGSGFLIGLGFGGFLVDFISLTGTLFGMKWMHKTWPIYEFAYGGGGFLGPLIGGLYFDKLGSYSGVFVVALIPTIAALLVSLMFVQRNTQIDSTQISTHL